jgi:hypothetical protein
MSSPADFRNLGLEYMHNFSVMARVLLNGESRFLGFGYKCLLQPEEIAVARLALTQDAAS